MTASIPSQAVAAIPATVPAPVRTRHRDLHSEIVHDGTRFQFFQAVRLLALSRGRAAEHVHTPKALTFRSQLSLAFPASEITRVSVRQAHAGHEADTLPAENAADHDGHAAAEMEISFLGMTGPSAVLPMPYTETLLARRQHHRDTAAHAFLDIFTHRSASLFYEAWRKYHFHIGVEQGERDGLERHLLDLGGLGLSHLRDRLRAAGARVPDRFFAYFSGLVSQRPHSATAIAAVLRGYFGCEISMEQYVGEWMAVPPAEQSCLGSWCCGLGETALAGERIWDRQHRVSLSIGPLDRAAFDDFLPGRPAAMALHLLIEFFLGSGLACNATLLLRAGLATGAMLAPGDVGAGRLGYDSWLGEPAADRMLDDVRFMVLA